MLSKCPLVLLIFEDFTGVIDGMSTSCLLLFVPLLVSCFFASTISTSPTSSSSSPLPISSTIFFKPDSILLTTLDVVFTIAETVCCLGILGGVLISCPSVASLICKLFIIMNIFNTASKSLN